MNKTGLILLEGPDGAGKTTLAEHICKRYNGTYIHRTWSKTMDVWEHHTEGLRLANDYLAEGKLVVMDRLYPSEMIYGKAFRNGGQYGDYNARSMERVFLRMAGVMVLAVPKNIEYIKAVHAEKFKKGLEHFDSVSAVAERYVDWAYGSKDRPVDGDLVEQQSALGGFIHLNANYPLVYNVIEDGDYMDDVADEIIARLEITRQRQFSAALDTNTPNVLGHKAMAKFLFIGERVGDPKGWSRWPFYGKRYSPDFLNRALHELRFNETHGAWTNAWDESNCLPKIYAEAPHLKVIPLGREAERRCNQLRIPIHYSVPHPSYAMRFDRANYVEELRKALEL